MDVQRTSCAIWGNEADNSEDLATFPDKISLEQLGEISIERLYKRTISFQGKDLTVEDLLIDSNKFGEIDEPSIEELLRLNRNIEIPLGDSSRINNVPSIPRRFVKFAYQFDEQFWCELATELKVSRETLQNQCTIDQQGIVYKCFVDDHEKSRLWKKMNEKLKKNKAFNLTSIVTEDHFRETKRITIISGVAGTGKSTILSRFCDTIKENQPSHWVIRINLSDHYESLSQFTPSADRSLLSAVKFLTNLPFVVNAASPFSRSLLRRRLMEVGKITLMLDGFDEVGNDVQEKIIQLVKIVMQMEISNVYITTRPHLKDELQDQLYQFAYTLDNFTEADQIDYLTEFWMDRINREKTQEIQEFAKRLVSIVSWNLEEEERDFIGVPLQCHILAECVENQLANAIQQGSSIDFLIQDVEKDLNLAGMYRLLLKRKREIYRMEKLKVIPENQLLNSLIEDNMENWVDYLTKLAIETIVNYQDDVRVLGGQRRDPIQSDKRFREKEKENADNGIRFGLLDKNPDGKLKFLHRTYAEYLLAECLYKALLPDYDPDHTTLLNSESCRDL